MLITAVCRLKGGVESLNPSDDGRRIKQGLAEHLAHTIVNEYSDYVTVERDAPFWHTCWKLDLHVFTREALEEYVEWRIRESGKHK